MAPSPRPRPGSTGPSPSPPDGHPGIVDIAVDGVSVTRAMREDFTSVLRSSGGVIQALLDALVHKAEANEQIARNDRVVAH
ncbi:hypothetical protein [Phaeospirillum tilakii]|uniref:Uncharacterized protein n=1 Tax=Phaeospirillum tilakii TaxID=741673 RepID=A0ABW5CDN0_9PROT